MKIDVPQIFEGRNQSQLAKAVGVSRAAICKWRRVPIKRVIAVEAATGIPRDELRPDYYPPKSDPA